MTMQKKNYNYGKIEDGKLVYAPNMLIIIAHDEEGHEYERQIFNAPAEVYLEQGWMPIERDQYPDDGHTYQERYEVEDDVIHVRWQQIIVPDYPSLDEQVEANSAAIIEIAAEIWG